MNYQVPFLVRPDLGLNPGLQDHWPTHTHKKKKWKRLKENWIKFSINIVICQNRFISSNSVEHKYIVQFYLTHRYDPIRYYHSELKWTWDRWKSRGTLHSKKLSITEHTPSDCLVSYPGHSLACGSYFFCRGAVGVFYSHNRLDMFSLSFSRYNWTRRIQKCNHWYV